MPKNFSSLAKTPVENKNTDSIPKNQDLALNSGGFVSLAEAEKYCLYTQEYLSLLARRGILRAEKVGRNWSTKWSWLFEYVKNHPQEDLNYNRQLERLRQKAEAEAGEEKASNKKLGILGGAIATSPQFVLARKPFVDRTFYSLTKILIRQVVFLLRVLKFLIRNFYHLTRIGFWGYGQGFVYWKKFFLNIFKPRAFYQSICLNIKHLTKLQQVKVCGLGVFVFSLSLSLFLNLLIPSMAVRFNNSLDQAGAPLIESIGRGTRSIVLTLIGCDVFLRQSAPEIDKVIVREFKNSFSNFRGLLDSAGEKTIASLANDFGELFNLPKERAGQLVKFISGTVRLVKNSLLAEIDRFGKVAGESESLPLKVNTVKIYPQDAISDSSVVEQAAAEISEKTLAIGLKLKDKLIGDVRQLSLAKENKILSQVSRRMENDTQALIKTPGDVSGRLVMLQKMGAKEVEAFNLPIETRETGIINRFNNDWLFLKKSATMDLKQMKDWMGGRVLALKDSGKEFYQKLSVLMENLENNLGNGYLVLSDIFQRSARDEYHPLDSLVRETPRSLDKPVPTGPKLAAGEEPVGVTGAGGEEMGAVVAPLTAEEAREEAVNRLRESFSDEVKLEPDVEESGTITPVYPATPEEKYLYVIVPVRE